MHEYALWLVQIQYSYNLAHSSIYPILTVLKKPSAKQVMINLILILRVYLFTGHEIFDRDFFQCNIIILKATTQGWILETNKATALLSPFIENSYRKISQLLSAAGI